VNRLRAPVLLAAALLPAGCLVGPDYEPPARPVPSAWTAGEAGKVDLARWWERFGDPLLDGLVVRALEANPDLEIARARVARAAALAGVGDGALFPTLEAGGSMDRIRRSENAAPFPPQLYRTRSYAGFSSTWEIDLFGGTRRSLEAADADLEAAEADLSAARVSLLGQLGAAYLALRGSQHVRRSLEEGAATARETALLTRLRVEAGVATALDLHRAEAQAAAAEAGIPPVEAETRRASHRIAVLTGRDPAALLQELGAPAPIPSVPPSVVVGLPSELILRRPDLRSTERRLAAATARVGAALGDYYPKFSLTGAFGLESLERTDLLQAASRTWTLGPALRWPIFSGGRIRASVLTAEAGVAEAAAAHERAVLQALEEVENALVAYLRGVERRRSLAQSASSSRLAAELAEELYRQGLANFLEVLDAQRERFSAERELAEVEASVTADLVTLYRVLGGGWEAPAER
jgi:multidrug efflux system outer membrane protein